MSDSVEKSTRALFADIMSSDVQLDACSLDCPLPLLKARKALREIGIGQTLLVAATDPASQRDFAAFAEQSGHGLLETAGKDGVYYYLLKRCF